MKETLYIVYKHTNKLNGKCYIGITQQLNYKKRWGYGAGYSKQLKFYNAIEKYGWDNFDHEILYTGLSAEEAGMLEKELIKKYDSQNNGYNINEGGENVGYHHSNETKQKLAKLIWITNGSLNKRIHDISELANYPNFYLGYTKTEKQKQVQQKKNENYKKEQEIALAQWLAEKHTCKTCGCVMTIKYGKGEFCCKSCAVTHKHSEETKQLLAEMNQKGICGNLGKKFTEEHKQKIGKANTGKVRTEEYKKHSSEVHKGQTPWNKGKKMHEKRVRINNGIIEKNVLEQDLLLYINNGWQRGRLRRTK